MLQVTTTAAAAALERLATESQGWDAQSARLGGLAFMSAAPAGTVADALAVGCDVMRKAARAIPGCCRLQQAAVQLEASIEAERSGRRLVALDSARAARDMVHRAEQEWHSDQRGDQGWPTLDVDPGTIIHAWLLLLRTALNADAPG